MSPMMRYYRTAFWTQFFGEFSTRVQYTHLPIIFGALPICLPPPKSSQQFGVVVFSVLRTRKEAEVLVDRKERPY